jgi:hypothetical protein
MVRCLGGMLSRPLFAILYELQYVEAANISNVCVGSVVLCGTSFELIIGLNQREVQESPRHAGGHSAGEQLARRRRGIASGRRCA